MIAFSILCSTCALQLFLPTLKSIFAPLTHRSSSQHLQNSSSSQVKHFFKGGKGGAREDHEEEEKVASDMGKGTYEYRKGMGVEVRCCGMGEGGAWVVEM